MEKFLSQETQRQERNEPATIAKQIASTNRNQKRKQKCNHLIFVAYWF